MATQEAVEQVQQQQWQMSHDWHDTCFLAVCIGSGVTLAVTETAPVIPWQSLLADAKPNW